MNLLEHDILAWDKKSKAAIQAVHDKHVTEGNFLSDLISLTGKSGTQCGATWLIKHHVENGLEDPNAEQVTQIISNLGEMDEWTSRLHVLQAVHHMKIPEGIHETANQYFRSSLNDDNKFVRAWAYSTLGHLACQYAQYREEIFLLLHDGLDREIAGSVRARLNKALKELTKNC